MFIFGTAIAFGVRMTKKGIKLPPWIQRSRSNLLKICNKIFIVFLIDGVHILHNDCLWYVNYNIGL